MTSLFGPPKLSLVVLFDYFDFKCSNSTLPNSTLYTLINIIWSKERGFIGARWAPLSSNKNTAFGQKLFNNYKYDNKSFNCHTSIAVIKVFKVFQKWKYHSSFN